MLILHDDLAKAYQTGGLRAGVYLWLVISGAADGAEACALHCDSHGAVAAALDFQLLSCTLQVNVQINLLAALVTLRALRDQETQCNA